MQNKIYKLIFILLISFFIHSNVYAECTYKDESEVSAYATNVTMGYSVIDEYEGKNCSQDDETKCIDNQYSGFHFVVYINNLNDKVYAVVTEDRNNTTTKYYYNETNKGNIAITSNYSEEKVNYKIEIRALNGNCSEKTLRTKTVTTPRYNKYSSYAACEGFEDFYLCQRFYDFNVSEDDFFTKINSHKNQTNTKENIKKANKDQNILSNFLDDYYLYLIGGGIIIISIFAVVIIKNRKKRVI